MYYEFPIINTLQDVLPHIEGFDEIIVAERDGYKVVNYMVSTPRLWERSHGWEVRRECRGLIFDDEGRLISRPFHKFFNLGEKEETLPNNVDVTELHHILDKMDGSMIRPLLLPQTYVLPAARGLREKPVKTNLYLATKMGVTDIANDAVQLLSTEQIALLIAHVEEGFTPLFEYVAPTNKIVINYTEAKLVYLGSRRNENGLYFFDRELSDFFERVPFRGMVRNGGLLSWSEGVRGETAGEGYILRFESGHMVKVKNDWYVRVHKTLDDVRSDRAIVALGLNEELDDVLPLIPEEDRDRVTEVFDVFMWKLIDKHVEIANITKIVDEQYRLEGGAYDKKRLALEFVPSLNDKKLGQFVFAFADGKDLWAILLQNAKNCVGSGVKYDEFVNWLS
jgi:RNA ligase